MSNINWKKIDRESQTIKPVPADRKQMQEYEARVEKETESFLREQNRYHRESLRKLLEEL